MAINGEGRDFGCNPHATYVQRHAEGFVSAKQRTAVPRSEQTPIKISIWHPRYHHQVKYLSFTLEPTSTVPLSADARRNFSSANHSAARAAALCARHPFQ